MTLTIEIDPATEKKLHDEADRAGVEASNLAAKVLSDHLEPKTPESESELLIQINEGWPAERWSRYRTLVAKRDARELSQSEHQELLEFTRHLEGMNAHRLGLLAKLAEIRQVDLKDLMDELGITPQFNGAG